MAAIKEIKGVYYFQDYRVAAHWGEANGYPTNYIRKFEKGWALQYRPGGCYAPERPTR